MGKATFVQCLVNKRLPNSSPSACQNVQNCPGASASLSPGTKQVTFAELMAQTLLDAPRQAAG